MTQSYIAPDIKMFSYFGRQLCNTSIHTDPNAPNEQFKDLEEFEW